MAGEMNTVTSYNFLLALFNGTTWANVLQNAGSPLTNFYLAFHTADPGLSGNQTTNEVSYTGYTGQARTAIARTSGGFTVTQNSGVSSSVALTSAVSAPMCTGGTATAANFSIGTASTGAGSVLYSGTVTPNISISTNVTPQLQAGTIITQT
jgi:hypothetical protein